MRILHLENSKLFHLAVEKVVVSLNHLYYGVHSSNAAFELLNNEDFQLIITGIEIEGDSGEFFIEQLADSKFSDIPVVVLTSTDDIRLRKRLYQLGVIDYQLKSNFSSLRFKSYIESLVVADKLHSKMKDFKIAVVDDSEFSLKAIKKIFDFHKISNVDYFLDVKSLMAMDVHYDMYIIDLVLPESSSEELVLKLKDINSDSIIVIISSTSNHKTISHLLNLGANDFIVKPFDANTFIVRLKSHIRMNELIKELEKRNYDLLKLSVTDELTQIYNHRHIIELLRNEVTSHSNSNRKSAIILFDLDNFKKVNDTYGHLVGDDVLKKVAMTMSNCLRDTDQIGRYGGEEFLIVLPETDIKEAITIAEKLKEKVRLIQYEIPELNTSVSGGIATNDYGEDYRSMLKRADEKLYIAKGKGKNQIVW